MQVNKSSTVKPLILVTLNFGIISQFYYFGPRNFSVFAFTTLKLYCIQIFANLPGSRNSRNKGHTKKNGFYSINYSMLCKNILFMKMWSFSIGTYSALTKQCPAFILLIEFIAFISSCIYQSLCNWAKHLRSVWLILAWWKLYCLDQWTWNWNSNYSYLFWQPCYVNVLSK